MNAGRRIVLNNKHATRHAQVNNCSAVARVDEQVLGATLDGFDCSIAKLCFHVVTDRPAQATLANNDIDDALSDEVR